MTEALPPMANDQPPILPEPKFLVAAHESGQWPEEIGVEVAFAGRSNVGKSSAINRIFNNKKLARTSKTPGRTQQLVFFALDGRRRVVDLPGYGFAKVPAALRRHWQAVIERYLVHRRTLRGLVLLMDIRHPMTDLDQQLLDWCEFGSLPVHVMLTKADKLGRGRAARVTHQVKKHLDGAGQRVSLQTFSAFRGTGVDQVRQQLWDWLNGPSETGGP